MIYCPSFDIVSVMLSESPPWITTCGLSRDRVIGLLAEALLMIGVKLVNTIKQTNNVVLKTLRDIRPDHSSGTPFLSESEVWTNFA